MKNVKKIFSYLILIFLFFSFLLKSANSNIINVQFIDPQKDSIEVTPTPGENILIFYSSIELGLNYYNNANQKCAPYFKENEIEQKEFKRASKALSDLKVCFQKKTGQLLTDQKVKEAIEKNKTHGNFDLSLINMIQRFSGSAIGPRSIKDANMCKEKASFLSMTMIPLGFTEFPSSGWCSGDKLGNDSDSGKKLKLEQPTKKKSMSQQERDNHMGVVR